MRRERGQSLRRAAGESQDRRGGALCRIPFALSLRERRDRVLNRLWGCPRVRLELSQQLVGMLRCENAPLNVGSFSGTACTLSALTRITKPGALHSGAGFGELDGPSVIALGVRFYHLLGEFGDLGEDPLLRELGHPIHPQRLSDWFTRHRKAAGIPAGSLHILRHTAATLALTATPPVPLHVVAGRLGDDPKTVLDTYAHVLSTSDEAAADVIAEALV